MDAERAIIAALEAADDERIWEAIGRAQDEDRLMQVVAEEAPRMTHRLRRTANFSELLLIPVIERDGGSVVDGTETWAAAEHCISEAFRAWLGPRANHTLFRRVLPYEWIAAWGPSLLRRHLAHGGAHSGSSRITFTPEQVFLPSGAPRLGFILVTVTSERSWPRLPIPDTVRDARFRDVVGHAFATRRDSEPALVLPPDQVPAALSDGMCLWLAVLHEAVSITEWDISPCGSRPDAVKVSLSFEQHGVRSEVILRRHQLGSGGIDCIACMLGSLAPCVPQRGAQ